MDRMMLKWTDRFGDDHDGWAKLGSRYVGYVLQVLGETGWAWRQEECVGFYKGGSGTCATIEASRAAIEASVFWWLVDVGFRNEGEADERLLAHRYAHTIRIRMRDGGPDHDDLQEVAGITWDELDLVMNADIAGFTAEWLSNVEAALEAWESAQSKGEQA